MAIRHRFAVTPRDIGAARSLRDALWRLTWRSVSGEPADSADLLILNQSAAEPPMVLQIGPDGRSRWR